MLDPLRSLAELVRTLSRSRADGRTGETQRRQATGDHPHVSDRPPNATSAAEALRESLRQRLRAVGVSDPRRAREAFVETVLASELGDSITLDPAMSEIISKVAEQLGADADTSRDLSLLFEELASDPR